MTRAAVVALVALVALVAPGCGSDPAATPTTEGVPLGELTLRVSGRSNGEVVLVQASLARGSDTLALGGTDRLVARAGDVEVVLGPVAYSHYALLPTSATSFDVVLDRGATRGVVHATLPAPFALTGPGIAPRRSPMTFVWGPPDPAAPTLELVLDGGCLAGPTYRRPASDTGNHTFDPADVFVSTNPCNALFRVSRSLRTSVASFEGFAGATATTEQVRTLTFRIQG